MLTSRVVITAGLLGMTGALVMAGAPLAQQAEPLEPGSIRIAVNGENRVGLIPRPEPYLDGGPRVGFPIGPVEGILAKDGRPVAALEAIAWLEGSGARVMVFGLSDRGSEGSKRFLTSMLIEWDSAGDFAPLAQLGIRGVSVTTGPRPDR